MPKTTTLKFTRTLNAPAAEAYRAFTNGSALRQWLCDTAVANAKKGGALYHGWNSGAYAFGEFVTLNPDKKIAFDWEGHGDPGKMRVTVTLQAHGDKTILTLTNAGIGNSAPWKKLARELTQGWNDALDNLQSVLETGQDLRLVRRPLMGISGGGEMNAEVAAQIGVPVTAGARLGGTTADLGAHRAGLQKDDVLINFGGKRVTNFATLLSALQPHRAGDKVKVVYYRGAQKMTTLMELSPRPIPDVPLNARELADLLRKQSAELDAEAKKSFEGANETHAAFRAAPNEWNAKETLAHLIANQRDMHTWIAAMVEGDEADNTQPANGLARIAATATTFNTMPALLSELAHNEAETAALIENLPAEFVAHKGSMWRIGFQLLFLVTHARGHLPQIRASIEAAQK